MHINDSSSYIWILVVVAKSLEIQRTMVTVCSIPWLGIHIFIYHIYGQLLALVWLNLKTSFGRFSIFKRITVTRSNFYFYFFGKNLQFSFKDFFLIDGTSGPVLDPVVHISTPPVLSF
jgi:hypothetical protein